MGSDMGQVQENLPLVNNASANIKVDPGLGPELSAR